VDAEKLKPEHGIDAVSATRRRDFNSGPDSGNPEGARIHERELDLTNRTATRVWTYAATPPSSNTVLGDVQRMPNGNTVIAYSAQGIVHEVDADQNLLQEIVWPIGGAFGYMIKRPTLYGPWTR
jgi:hypothetical protein